MNITKRALSAVALAGAALSLAEVAHASQVVENGTTSMINRDESTNLYEDLSDSVAEGMGNVIRPLANVPRLTGPLLG
ncbi:hypothetical protein ACFV2I_36265 [Streptomyces microflavus]|uniref:hypothetical protein n=1 Tax=Streptomyces microflavus TaxID=1919 RepID=UPI003698163F